MQNLLKIVARYSNFLVFIALEVVAFLLISFNSAYPRSSMLSTANRFVAWQYAWTSALTDYLHLRRVNEELAAENARLRGELAAQTAYEAGFKPAQVVQMTTDQQHNYLTINRGKNDGVYSGMGVRNNDGVVGIVRTVGSRYSVVQPVINTESRLSCRFSKNEYIATLEWDGKDSRFARLADVATHVDVVAGDTVITSGLSPAFPEGIPVGIVEDCALAKGASYYTIRVRLNADFKRLRYVETVGNSDRAELEELNDGLD